MLVVSDVEDGVAAGEGRAQDNPENTMVKSLTRALRACGSSIWSHHRLKYGFPTLIVVNDMVNYGVSTVENLYLFAQPFPKFAQKNATNFIIAGFGVTIMSGIVSIYEYKNEKNKNETGTWKRIRKIYRAGEEGSNVMYTTMYAIARAITNYMIFVQKRKPPIIEPTWFGVVTVFVPGGIAFGLEITRHLLPKSIPRALDRYFGNDTCVRKAWNIPAISGTFLNEMSTWITTIGTSLDLSLMLLAYIVTISDSLFLELSPFVLSMGLSLFTTYRRRNGVDGDWWEDFPLAIATMINYFQYFPIDTFTITSNALFWAAAIGMIVSLIKFGFMEQIQSEPNEQSALLPEPERPHYFSAVIGEDFEPPSPRGVSARELGRSLTDVLRPGAGQSESIGINTDEHVSGSDDDPALSQQKFQPSV